MTNLDSPSVGSPETPINVASVPNVKIDTDFSEESDARHEPIPLKLEQHSKIDQDVIVPIDPRHETPSRDVEMQEQGQEDGTTPPVLSPFPSAEEDHDQDAHGGANGVNGHVIEGDAKMRDVEDVKDETGAAPLPPTSPTPPAEDGSQGTNADADESNAHVAPEDQPHPAKRARKHSDADAASVMSNTTPPPPPAPVPTLNGMAAHPPPTNPTPIHTQPSTSTPPASSLTLSQHKFCTSTLKNLKKSRDARPFLFPVDVVAMNIPHYPEIITHPMDFKTIEDKLENSVPGKEVPKPDQPRYLSADQFIVDVRLVFSNCVKFNGPEHTISLMGRRLEELFDKSIKNLPPPEEAKPAPVKKAPPPPPAPVPTTAPAKQRAPRRPSTSTPVIRRNDSTSASGSRPKREIHPPPSKDLPYADVSKKSRKARAAKDNLNAEQLRFCSKLLGELHKKPHWNIASPFYEPVDWVSLNIPTYPKIIKEPMDLSTMRKKLDAHEYPTAQAFFLDFKLMIRNCFHFNPPGTPVNLAGIELQRLFDDKWKNLPVPKPAYDEDMDVEDDDSEDDNQHRIAEMEKQIEAMRGTISALKQQKKEKQPKKPARQQPAPAAASSSKPAKAAASSSKKTSTKKSGKKSAAVPGDDDVLTFEQKKDLSEAIQTLDGQKLERVIQIIHEGVPEIRDSTEEIELEIDLLPANVLIKLYNFVIRPLKAAQPKRARTGKGTGTGGLKRKSMDEDVEAEKIRALEARIALFEKGTPTASNGDPGHGAGGVNGGGGDRSSDSSDSSDSGSDSE